MTANIGVERSEASIKAALASLKAMESEARSPEMAGMFTAALFVATGALICRESLGAHSRVDYPDSLAGLPRNSILTLSQMNEIVANSVSVDNPFEKQAPVPQKQTCDRIVGRCRFEMQPKNATGGNMNC